MSLSSIFLIRPTIVWVNCILNFYATIQKSLNPDGVVVIQTTSPYFAPNHLVHQQNSMQVFLQVDAYHAYVPSFENGVIPFPSTVFELL
jgi:spermidine synthase